MKHGTNPRRGRARGNGKRHMPSRNQNFESNGPDIKVRGTAQQVLEKYLTLARDASSAGDRIQAESYLQYAEHYYRMLSSTMAQNPGGERISRPSSVAMAGDGPMSDAFENDDIDDDGDEDDGNESTNNATDTDQSQPGGEKSDETGRSEYATDANEEKERPTSRRRGRGRGGRERAPAEPAAVQDAPTVDPQTEPAA